MWSRNQCVAKLVPPKPELFSWSQNFHQILLREVIYTCTVNVKKNHRQLKLEFCPLTFFSHLKTIHPTLVPAAEKGLKRRARTQTPHLSTFEHSLTPMCQQSNISPLLFTKYVFYFHSYDSWQVLGLLTIGQQGETGFLILLNVNLCFSKN